MLPLTLAYSVAVAGHSASRASTIHTLELQHAQGGSHNFSQLKPWPRTPLSSAAPLGPLLQKRTGVTKHDIARKRNARSSQDTELALLQQQTHQTRLRKLESTHGPARGGQYMFGLPKIVIVIVADVIAMMIFLACIPMLLSCAKRRKLFS